jgi:hypothetical protein
MASEYAIVLVLAAGAYNLGFAIFHLAFWRVFRWPASLVGSGGLNSAITQTLNVVLIYCFLFYGGALLWLGASGQRVSPLLLLAGAGFWFVRTVLQPLMFSFRQKASVAFTMLFLGGCVLHVLAALPLGTAG